MNMFMSAAAVFIARQLPLLLAAAGIGGGLGGLGVQVFSEILRASRLEPGPPTSLLCPVASDLGEALHPPLDFPLALDLPHRGCHWTLRGARVGLALLASARLGTCGAESSPGCLKGNLSLSTS